MTTPTGGEPTIPPAPQSLLERDEISFAGIQNSDVAWAQIGRQLARHSTTISREMKRSGSRRHYRPASADTRAAPGLFAGPVRFAEYYRVPIEKHSDAERMAQLRRRIRPLLLSRTKEQVARDLPDKQEQVLELELSPKHKKVYQRYLQRKRRKVIGLLEDVSKNRFEIFRSLTLLRQASLDVSLIDVKHVGVSWPKLDVLTEMLDDIVSDGHRVLVFSQFTRFLATARSRIRTAGIDHCYLDGRTRNRPAVITEFREGRAPVFLISLKAGGFGLNLTEADYCILLDPWWNPATEAQAVDRVHRIGQTRKVMVYRLVAKDAIEEKVMALKAKKAALFANVMDGGAFESGAMTAADIRDLLS
jgi:SNF2 family DNA or RNA helicase